MHLLVAVLLMCMACCKALADFQAPAYVAIIIDDIGHNRQRAEQMIAIPAPLTFAIIPETTHAKHLATRAFEAGREVMVHLPMENTQNQPMGNLHLTRQHQQADFDAIVKQALSAVPYASGVNNHMGSALTQRPQSMAWLMRSIKRHNLYFIDSRTTNRTVANEIALQEHLRAASRDVFLDNERTLYETDRQFRELIRTARAQKTAIGIGHPYPTTLEYLSLAMSLLESEGIELVSVSELLAIRRSSLQIASSAYNLPASTL